MKLKNGMTIMRTLFLLMGLGLASTLIGIAGTSPYFSGSGTALDPYLITSDADLAALASHVNAGERDDNNIPYSAAYYLQVSDIDLASYGSSWNGGVGWIPIGSYDNGTPFTGTYDGGHFTISNLYIRDVTKLRGGLFDKISFASLKNINMTDVNVYVDYASAGLVAQSENSSIESCQISGTVQGNTYVGGLAGFIYDTTISSCMFDGFVIGNDQRVGGLVSDANASTIENSVFVGEITGDTEVGGIVGNLTNTSLVLASYVKANIIGNSNIGGIAGNAYSTVIIKDTYVIGALQGVNTIGGIVATANNTAEIYNNISYVSINGGSTLSYIGNAYSGSYFHDNVSLNNDPYSVAETISRVSSVNQGTLANNYASTTITQGSGLVGLNDQEGGDLDISQIALGDFWLNDLGFDSTVWDIQEGKLPLLKNMPRGQISDMPAYLSGVYFENGSGTSASPYEIASVEELSNLAYLMNEPYGNTYGDGKYFILVNDLDLSGFESFYSVSENWVPIGNGNDNNSIAVFDGNQKSISNMTVDLKYDVTDYCGLFGSIKVSRLTDLTITGGHVKNGYYMGLLGGLMSLDTLKNIEVDGQIETQLANSLGGIIGLVGPSMFEPNISQVSSSVDITSYNGSIGGLFGLFQTPGHISDSYSLGSINSTRIDTQIVGGGLVGGFQGDIQRSYSNVDIDGSFAGGLIGETRGPVSLSNAYSSGDLSAINHAGGLIGYQTDQVTLSQVFSAGTMTSDGTAGGSLGYLSEMGLLGSDFEGVLVLNAGISGGQDLTNTFGIGMDMLNQDPVETFSGVYHLNDMTILEDGQAVTQFQSQGISLGDLYDTEYMTGVLGFDPSIWDISSDALPTLKNLNDQVVSFGSHLEARDIDASMVLGGLSPTYDGRPQTPDILVTYGSDVLIEGRDYKIVNLSQNTAAGTSTYDLMGTGAYYGTKTGLTFDILKSDLLTEVDHTVIYVADGDTSLITFDVKDLLYNRDDFSITDVTLTYNQYVPLAFITNLTSSGSTISFQVDFDNDYGTDVGFIMCDIDTDNFQTLSVMYSVQISSKLQQVLSFDQSQVTKDYGDLPFTYSPNLISGEGTGAATYESSNPDVASVDAQSGEVTLLDPGYATITASKAADDLYEKASASYYIKVNPMSLIVSIDDVHLYTGQTLPEITLTYQGFKEGDRAETVFQSLPTGAYIVENTDYEGTTRISIGQMGQLLTAYEERYEITYVPGTLSVTNAYYTIHFNGNGGTGTMADLQVAQGASFTVNACEFTKTGYEFAYWDLGNNRLYGDEYFTFDQVIEDMEVLVIWAIDPDADQPTTDPTPSPTTGPSSTLDSETPEEGLLLEGMSLLNPIKPNDPATFNYQLAGGSLLEDDQMDQFIEEARRLSQEVSGSNGFSMVFDFEADQDQETPQIDLSKSAFQKLVEAEVEEVTFKGLDLQLDFDLNALKAIEGQADSNIRIQTSKVSALTPEASAVLGDRPVYNIEILDEGGQAISDFGQGKVKLTIPYTPITGESVDYLYAIYISVNGEITELDGSYFDPEIGAMVFETNHFSTYGIAYREPCDHFTDISNHWATGAIDFVAGQALLNGTSQTTFSPDLNITRGMLMTILGNMSDIDTSQYKESQFEDVSEDQYYSPYIEWAVGKGIIEGKTEILFDPESQVTRQEIALIFYNYAQTSGFQIPSINDEPHYLDADLIDTSYRIAVDVMYRGGIMVGTPEGKFMAQSYATRAELSVMLMKFLELSMDPAYASGWTRDAIGSWYYYQEGLTLTGWQTIDDLPYYFDESGILQTGWVQDGSDWRYYCGHHMHTGSLELEDGSIYVFDANGILIP